ncbi:MAG: hypothetical protein J3R72DRAFT_527181 [Linnemannia gamsii]|nr:MAG: hypothetical protein J3R72DRAFT_527181 [Linnemannia gamsii]
MLAKVACLAIATVTTILTWLPPPSSKTVNAKKDKKVIEDEHAFVTTHANTFPFVMTTYSTVIFTAYLSLMMINVDDSTGARVLKGERQTSFFKSNHPALTQLGELHNWHFVATVLCVLGYSLRKWSYVTLDHFYTYQLAIRPDHKLIQTGPYAYIRHPGYAGMILNVLSWSHIMWYEGLFSVAVQYASHLVSSLLRIKFSIPMTTVMGFDIGIVATCCYIYVWYLGAMYRIPHEEELLKKTFEKEWDHFASTRARLIPGVY